MNSFEIFNLVFSRTFLRPLGRMIFPLLCCSLYFSGCSSLFHKKPLGIKNVKEVESNSSGKILRAEFLKKEDLKVVAVPFTAGESVVANQELERVSLMILKGILERFQEKKAPFQILSSDEAGKADVVIQGHILTKGHHGWMFRASNFLLSVEARMTERKTGNLILIFSRQQSVQSRKKDKDTQMQLAQRIGQDIAEFILDQVQH